MANCISWHRVILGGLAAGLALIIAEVIVEGLVLGALLGVGSEGERLATLGWSRADWGVWNHLINLALPLLTGMLLVALYAAIRPRFGPGPKTALVAAGFIVVYWSLVLIYMTNAGMWSLSIGIASFVDNLLIVPVATLAGARIYREQAPHPS